MSNLIPFDYNTWKTGNYDSFYLDGEIPKKIVEGLGEILSYREADMMCRHNLDGKSKDRFTPYDLMLRPKDKWIEGYVEIGEDNKFSFLCQNFETAKNAFHGSVLHLRWNPITKTGTIEEV